MAEWGAAIAGVMSRRGVVGGRGRRISLTGTCARAPFAIRLTARSHERENGVTAKC